MNNYEGIFDTFRFAELPLSGNTVERENGIVIFDLQQPIVQGGPVFDFFQWLRNFINYIYVILLMPLNAREHLDLDIPVRADRIYTTSSYDSEGLPRTISATVEPIVTPGDPPRSQSKLVVSHVNFAADICGALGIPCRDYYYMRAWPTTDQSRNMSYLYYEPNPGYLDVHYGDNERPVLGIVNQTVLSYGFRIEHRDPQGALSYENFTVIFQIDDFDDEQSATTYMNSGARENAQWIQTPPGYSFTVYRTDLIQFTENTARIFFWQPQSDQYNNQVYEITFFDNDNPYDEIIEEQYVYRIIEAYYADTHTLTNQRDIDHVAGVIMKDIWPRTAILTGNQDFITENWQAIAPQTRLW